jgi:hypothetical protein
MMKPSPLRQFVLTAAFWLPAMFALWFALRTAIVFPAIRIAGLVLHAWMPEIVTSMGQEYHDAVYSYIADVSGVAGLPASRLTVEEQHKNVLVYCYGVPLLFGLVMATPLSWARTFAQQGIGFAVLTAVVAFGLVGEVLKTMAFGVGAAVQTALESMEYGTVAAAAGAAAQHNMLASLAGHGLSLDAIGFIYQFGYLILPTVTPVALWILMNRRFLETLVGWGGEPDDADVGPSDANSGGTSA